MCSERIEKAVKIINAQQLRIQTAFGKLAQMINDSNSGHIKQYGYRLKMKL